MQRGQKLPKTLFGIQPPSHLKRGVAPTTRKGKFIVTGPISVEDFAKENKIEWIEGSRMKLPPDQLAVVLKAYPSIPEQYLRIKKEEIEGNYKTIIIGSMAEPCGESIFCGPEGLPDKALLPLNTFDLIPMDDQKAASTVYSYMVRDPKTKEPLALANAETQGNIIRKINHGPKKILQEGDSGQYSYTLDDYVFSSSADLNDIATENVCYLTGVIGNSLQILARTSEKIGGYESLVRDYGKAYWEKLGRNPLLNYKNGSLLHSMAYRLKHLSILELNFLAKNIMVKLLYKIIAVNSL